MHDESRARIFDLLKSYNRFFKTLNIIMASTILRMPNGIARQDKTKNKLLPSIQALSALKRAQLSEFKQALTEAVLISKGKMEAKPFSELWDE